MKEAKQIADRCFTGMSHCITGNGDWASARRIDAEIIQSALDRAYNQALADAADVSDEASAVSITALKRGQS